jgi:hypothetical protein
MAKQAGELFIEGTIDDLTFYKMDGKYYLRMKSSLTGKKFWRNKAFERSRASCKRFSEGNKLASKLYRMIEKEKKFYTLFCFLKKRAILLLKEGKNLTEAEEVLMDYLIEFGVVDCIEPQLQSTNKINCNKHPYKSVLKFREQDEKIIYSFSSTNVSQRFTCAIIESDST